MYPKVLNRDVFKSGNKQLCCSQEPGSDLQCEVSQVVGKDADRRLARCWDRPWVLGAQQREVWLGSFFLPSFFSWMRNRENFSWEIFIGQACKLCLELLTFHWSLQGAFEKESGWGVD